MQTAELPTVAFERDALRTWLDYYRVELLRKLDGLDEDQASQRVVGSLTTLHGLVRHMKKVEHVWFGKVLARRDDPAPFGWPEIRDGNFRLDDADPLDADVAQYLAACERSRQIFNGLSLNEIRQLHRLGDVDVRWVMIHMIEEYAQHNGHADIIRELIDGTTQT